MQTIVENELKQGVEMVKAVSAWLSRSIPQQAKFFTLTVEVIPPFNPTLRRYTRTHIECVLHRHLQNPALPSNPHPAAALWKKEKLRQARWK